MRSRVKPSTPADRKLSIKHLKDSIRYNESHAREHLKQVKRDRQLLRKTKRG